jgi:hypothetical protein
MTRTVKTEPQGTRVLSEVLKKCRLRHDAESKIFIEVEGVKPASRSDAAKERPTAMFGKWALIILVTLFVLPLVCFLAFEIFHIRIGSPYFAVYFILIMIYAGLPGCFVSLVLGTVGILRKEHPIKPAIYSVGLSVLPVLLGLWVLKNYITMGEPW